jgi:hypothetical protein
LHSAVTPVSCSTQSGLGAHPVIGHEVAASELQELAIGGVIHRFDAYHAPGYRRRVRLKVFEELELGGGRPNDQDFASILDCVRDGLIVRMILRYFARAYDAVFVVQVLMLGFRMDDTRFRVVWVELDNMCFAVVYPYDTVIVAHWARGLGDRGRQVYAVVSARPRRGIEASAAVRMEEGD